MSRQPSPASQHPPLGLERIAAKAPRAQHVGALLVDGMLRRVYEDQKGPFYQTGSGRRVHFDQLITIEPRVVWGNYGSGYEGRKHVVMYVSSDSPLFPRSPGAARPEPEVMHHGAYAPV